MTRLGHNTIAKLERNETRSVQPWILGRILPFVQEKFNEAFPDAKGDAYDYLIPPKTFGGWMKNFRARRGLKLKELAKALKVHCYTVIRYEADLTKPDVAVRDRLRRVFGLNGELDHYL